MSNHIPPEILMYDERVTARLATLVILMVPFAFTMLLFKDVPQTVRDIIMVLVGVIAANATQAVQHRFGSTPASAKKDSTIATLANTASTAQAALAPLPGAAIADAIPVAVGEVKTVVGTGDVNE